MNIPRVLAIGANGFLGGHLLRAGDARFACIGAGRGGCEVTLDLTDRASIAEAMREAAPSIVVLTAALADIDACQREPDRARAVNVDGPRNVAEECARRGVRLLFTSSGAVFDGTREQYREEDAPSPPNVYGATKAEAERVVAELVPDAIIVRLSLLLGLPLRAGTNAFLDRIVPSLRAGVAARAPKGESRNAIDVGTVCRWMFDLAAARGARGIFHLGSADALSRFEITRGLAEALGYPSDLVMADEQPRPGRAPRGARELLAPGRIGQFSAVAVPRCRQAIERCVHAVA